MKRYPKQNKTKISAQKHKQNVTYAYLLLALSSLSSPSVYSTRYAFFNAKGYGGDFKDTYRNQTPAEGLPIPPHLFEKYNMNLFYVPLQVINLSFIFPSTDKFRRLLR